MASLPELKQKGECDALLIKKANVKGEQALKKQSSNV
jgi:hypothetical protein